MPRTKKQAEEPMSIETNAELVRRIEKTAIVLCQMLETLKEQGAQQELLARAEQGLAFGVLAAIWSLEISE